MTEDTAYYHGTYTPHPHLWGLLIGWLDPEDPDPAWKQFDKNLQMGWSYDSCENGMEIKQIDPYTIEYHYPGDPADRNITWMRFREETIYIDSYERVALKKDGKWSCVRCD